MATKTEHLQRAWHLYEKHNGHLPASAREAATWAVERGLIQLPMIWRGHSGRNTQQTRGVAATA